jgi:pyruvate formate lyase activating enzyme
MGKIAEIEGIIFKIKRFSVHDGPGIRTSVFLKGCPLNCIWCHSPEGISSDIVIWHDQSLCIACGECVNACPEKALELANEPQPHVRINRKSCIRNGDCVKICPTGALQFAGSKTSVTDVVDEIIKDILYYETSGGGVTLTGGEPLNQPYFSKEILKECKKRNIHTAIESCLFTEKETILAIMDFVDLFIVDIKIFDGQQHIRYTGKSNRIIKDNLQFLAETGKSLIVRVPVIPGITDTVENKNDCEKFVHNLNKHIPIEYLNYNPLTENNYKRLDIPFLIN